MKYVLKEDFFNRKKGHIIETIDDNTLVVWTYNGCSTNEFHPKNLPLLFEEYKPKLTFGDKEVTIKYIPGDYDFNTNIEIICENEKSTYAKCKELRNAIHVIETFRFGNKELKSSINLTVFKIGCTVGTISQIDNILAECEKLLK